MKPRCLFWVVVVIVLWFWEIVKALAKRLDFSLDFSSTFDLKVERQLSIVEHMWPNDSIFRSTFLSTFQLLIFPQRISTKNIYHYQYFPAHVDATAHAFIRLARQGGQTGRFSLNNSSFARFFWQRSNFTQHHSTPLDSLNKVTKRLDIFIDFLSSKNIEWTMESFGQGLRDIKAWLTK